MAPFLGTLRILGLCSVAAGHGSDGDICSPRDTGFHRPEENAVACYAGTFLMKMLAELNAGHKKTAQHVRYHLLPWMGGQEKVEQLREDYYYSNCSICYANTATADGLTALRAQVPAKVVEAYDDLQVCYTRLTVDIMDLLPTDETGVYMAPPHHESLTPFRQVRGLFQELFDGHHHEEGLQRFLGCSEWPDVSNLTYPVLTNVTYVDPCNYENHGIDDPQEAAAFCYVGTFMQVMLTELTQSPPLGSATKTQQHVWTHFTPWCGSNATTYALYTDNLENATCATCYNRTISADHFVATLTMPGCYTKSPPLCDARSANVQAYLDAKKMWDDLDVCYVRWSNYFMEALPRLGNFLLPPRAPETPFTTALRITREIVRKHGVRACGDKLPVLV